MQEIHVVGAAIIEGTKVLAAQRSSKMKEPLKWEFAGGKVEEGETHQQALEREICEELCCKVKVGRFIATGSSIFDGRRILLHVYQAELVEGKPIAREHAQTRWLDIKDIMSLDWAEADIPACNKLVELYS